MSESTLERWALQFCHCHYGPFADVGRQYANTLRRLGFKVCTVYLTGEAREDIRALTNSDEVIFLGFSSREVSGLKLSALKAFRRIVKERDYRFVIAHRFKPIYVACLASGLPVFGVSHSFGDYRRVGRRAFARVFRKRLTLLAVSNAVRDEIRQCLPDWREDEIQTCYNRLDVDRVRAGLTERDAARDTLGLPREAFVVANVGRLHPDKDQATLIRAFAHARERLPAGALLAIIGSGRLEAKLEALAQELGLGESVRLLGQVPEVWRHFRAFDVFALSSDHEPFGMVLLEAMVAGVPVIATDCGGAPEVLVDIAPLVPLGDSERLADGLVQLAGLTDEGRSTFAAAALARVVAQFSDEVAPATLARLLSSVGKT
ncbi:glycosyltransferase [Rhodocyclaceae bacterium SMB388]